MGGKRKRRKKKRPGMGARRKAQAWVPHCEAVTRDGSKCSRDPVSRCSGLHVCQQHLDMLLDGRYKPPKKSSKTTSRRSSPASRKADRKTRRAAGQWNNARGMLKGALKVVTRVSERKKFLDGASDEHVKAMGEARAALERLFRQIDELGPPS